MRPCQEHVESLQRIRLEAHFFETEAYAGTIQHPHDHAFTVDGRHSRHPKVEFTPLHPGLDPAVLRQPALGDVEMGQQFHPRIDGSAVLGSQDLCAEQHTVDAVAHMQAIIERLQVDVGCSQVDHPADDGVDQANDGRFAGEILEVLDKITGVAVAFDRLVVGRHAAVFG